MADSATHRIWMIRNVSQGGTAQPLFGAEDGIEHPVALASQSQFLYVADSQTGVIQTYDLTALRKIEDLPLDSSPSTLEYFTPTSFLVNGRRKANDPVLILQTSPALTVTFIPAGVTH